jgi:cytochrome P450
LASRQSDYKHKRKPVTATQLRRQWLTRLIREIHVASRGTYGYRRVHAELTLGMGITVCPRTVSVLMTVAGIYGLPGPVWVRRLRGVATAVDLVNRKFHRLAPNELWVTDITQHRTREGWLYCCAVLGAFSRRMPMMIVGRIIGVPDGDTDKLIRWGYAATQVRGRTVTQEQLTAAGIAVMELSGYITELFQDATTNPQDNLLGDLASACATGELDQFTALAMMITLFSAGGESMASLIGSAAWILATKPTVQGQLREQPELLSTFLEEVLRLSRRSEGTTATSSTTPNWVALPCKAVHACS